MIRLWLSYSIFGTEVVDFGFDLIEILTRKIGKFYRKTSCSKNYNQKLNRVVSQKNHISSLRKDISPVRNHISSKLEGRGS